MQDSQVRVNKQLHVSHLPPSKGILYPGHTGEPGERLANTSKTCVQGLSGFFHQKGAAMIMISLGLANVEAACRAFSPYPSVHTGAHHTA